MSNRLACIAPLLLAVGCSGSDGTTTTAPGPELPRYASAMPLSLQKQVWNATNADLGTIAAVTELGDDLIVYGDKGAAVIAGAAVAATDASLTTWRTAATIPAADGNGSWAVGVDGMGRLHRLRAGASLEDVTDRYGLLADPVSQLASLGGTRAAFGLARQIAVADGTAVVRYDLTLSAISGGTGRLAGVASDGTVHVLYAASGQHVVYPTTDAVAVAFDADDKLIVATKHGLWIEGPLRLSPLYADATIDFRGLVASGAWTWALTGSALFGLYGDMLYGASGPAIAATTTITGSPSGDIWLLAGGKLERWSAPVSGDEALWRQTVLPVSARVCASCHEPGGSAGIALATYPQWLAHKAQVYSRVVVKGDMPQGRSIDDADKMAIATWSKP